MRRRGSTLIEMLVGALIALLVGAGTMQLMRASYADQQNVNDINNAATNARTPVDILADHLRNAQQVSSDNYAVVSVAHINDITYYADTAGATVRYRLNGTTLQRTDTAGNTTNVIGNVTSLMFTYYTSTRYNDTAAAVATASPHEPLDTERRFLTVIEIQATVSSGGFSRMYTTRVRLRNSPRKTSL